MEAQTPTVVLYGTPRDPEFMEQVVAAGDWGMVMDNGRARDAVFSIYENLGRADAIVAFPNANPLHLVTLIAEAEVGHPLIVQSRGAGLDGTPVFTTKPIIFYGSDHEWEPFKRMFDGMRGCGTLRDGFDRLVQYHRDPAEVRRSIAAALPQTIPTTRIDYYLHARKEPDLVCEEREGMRPPSDITISFFGSASCERPETLARTDRAASMCAGNGWNILHGGGDRSVMGRLSRAAAELEIFLTGVTVHSSGAPKISFERSDGDRRPEEIDQHIACKDMLHRIETYAGNAHGFVALDGGIGSWQEVLVIADLRSRHHPAAMYETASGQMARKPLWVLNESGMYSALLDYLETRGFNTLREQIQVAGSVAELEAGLQQRYELHPALPRSCGDRADFRERYAQIELPKAPVRLTVDLAPPRALDPELRIPDLGTLLGEGMQERPRGCSVEP